MDACLTEKPSQPSEVVRFKMPPFFEFQTQELIETGRDFYNSGVLTTPFKECVFETTYSVYDGDVRLDVRLHTKQEEDGNHLTRLSVKKRSQDEYKMLPFGVKITKNGTEFYSSEKFADEENLARWAYVIFLPSIMALNMKQFEQREVVAPEKLQKARARRGKPPIKNYIEVSLSKELRAALNAGGSGHRTPHWRRGHLRHLANGVVVPVSPCMVNWRGESIEPKEYRVRA